MSKIVTSRYCIHSSKFKRKMTFALLSDLHSREHTDIDGIIAATAAESPDLIFMPGDIFERLDSYPKEKNERGFELIERCSAIAPVFYSGGNHEVGGVQSWNKLKWWIIKSIPKYYAPEALDRIFGCGAVFLDDGYVVEDGIALGGLSSGLINETREPDLSWLDEFCALECPKILLCHHPEYYEKYLKNTSIDLIVSGHAHGGQWRFFGRGVYAPGQGVFPKYTSGVYDDRLVVSRGLKPSGTIPRIFNDPEIVIINVD